MNIHDLKAQKKEMAHFGYYIMSDFAALKNVSRQYIDKSIDSYEVILRYGRNWYKFDDGEAAIKKYEDPYKALKIFEDFGFKPRIKSLLINDKAIVDVKKIDANNINIRFYNFKGDMLCCNVFIKDVELVENISDNL